MRIIKYEKKEQTTVHPGVYMIPYETQYLPSWFEKFWICVAILLVIPIDILSFIIHYFRRTKLYCTEKLAEELIKSNRAKVEYKDGPEK